MAEFKVLLVDDEREFADTLAKRLRKRNLEARVATNGEEALRLIREEVPDVLVADLRMEGIDGVEVLQRVKADHPEVEVVILTGQIGTEVEEEARSCGAFDCLVKPLGVEEVVGTLRKAYENKLKRDQQHTELGQDGNFGSNT